MQGMQGTQVRTHRALGMQIQCRVRQDAMVPYCNDPTIGRYNHYHLSPNGIPRGNQRWYGLVYLIHIAGKPRIRPRE